MPADEKVNRSGAEALQPVADAAGGEGFSVIRYPITAMLSVAVRAVIGTVRDSVKEGMVNVATVGGVKSFNTLTVADVCLELPALS